MKKRGSATVFAVSLAVGVGVGVPLRAEAAKPQATSVVVSTTQGPADTCLPVGDAQQWSVDALYGTKVRDMSGKANWDGGGATVTAKGKKVSVRMPDTPGTVVVTATVDGVSDTLEVQVWDPAGGEPSPCAVPV